MRRLPALLVASLVLACSTMKDKDGVEREVNFVDGLIDTFKPPSPADGEPANPTLMLTFDTKKKAAGDGFGFLRANRRLYAPFEVLVVAGLVPEEDQSGFTGDAQICVELDERATITDDIADLLWVLVCARREGTGLRVRAQDQFATLGSVLLEATDAAVLVIRHDGTDLIFETGPAILLGTRAADGGLTEITRLDDWLPVTAGDALVPSMGASFLTHPTTVGFAEAQLIENGDPPAELTDAQDAAFDIGPAVDAAVRAFELLNGPAPDTTAARVELVAAQDALGTALAQVEALPVDKPQKKARSALKAAAKAMAAAIERLDKGAPPLKILKKVGASSRSAMQAIQALDPVPHF